MLEFPKRFKELRLERGLTQQILSKKLNIRQQSYNRYKHGTGEPSINTIIKLSQIFDVTIDYLLGSTDIYD